MTMAMVTSGHVAHARAMINEEFFLAWGNLGVGYIDPWSQGDVPPVATSDVLSETIVKGAANTTDELSETTILKVVEVKDVNNVVYTEDVNFYLDGNGINWSLGAAEPAPGLSYTVKYRYYTEDVSELINELGRRIASEVSYVVEDAILGDIVANNTKWRKVVEPTQHIYLTFRFDADEAINTSIYQVALFVGTVVDPSTPPGQQYFEPADIDNPGTMYMLENLEPFPRNAGKREIFEQVITY